MEDYRDHLKDIAEIRNLMEDSTRFASLSGLSGVGAGVVALIGAAGTYQFLYKEGIYSFTQKRYMATTDQIPTLVGIALLILVCALAVAIFFTIRRTRREGKKIFTRATSRLALNMMIPMAAGAVFCVELAYWGKPGLVAPATLIFYGMALLNAGKYTLREIRYLGIMEIVLGLLAGIWVGYGIIFWAVGFGVLHIAYGTMMYLKYER
ncbi:MAG: hypothetical protein AAFR61_28035 [Bacteroidota bacterium]